MPKAKKPLKKPAKTKPAKASKVKTKAPAKASKAKASKAKAGASKAIVNRIKETIVTPATKSEPVLVTPLPTREVRNFGVMEFDSQAKLVLQTFPADAAEIIGSTKDSGAGNVAYPALARQ
jgi:hypothetical protein